MSEIIVLFCVIFGASIVHKLFGFGFGALSVPLLTLFTSLQASVLLLLCLSSAIAAQNLFLHREHVDYRMGMQFIGISLIGIVIGFAIVDRVDSTVASILASIFILGAAFLSLSARKLAKSTIPIFPVATAAGLSNVVSAVNGPIIGLFFSHVNIQKETYLGTSSFVFLLVNILAIIAQLTSAIHTGLTANQVVIAFLAMGIGSYVGHSFFKTIDEASFKAYLLYAIILLASSSLILSVIRYVS